tara:strand:+ start:508 stop:2007 length:1500 start_codon:yes stop_codon:yes gene_type:complete
MDFLKEITITFSEIKKRNFEKFLSRKRPSDSRKDIEIFNILYQSYTKPSNKLQQLKGHPNYHATRKRITKELINFLILENSDFEIKKDNREHFITVAKYFIGFKKYQQAWEILKKEEKICDQKKDFLLNLKIQRLMLSILPYQPLVDFELVKAKILELKNQQAQVDEFQLYFIQIKNMFIDKIENGNVTINPSIFKKAIEQYHNIKQLFNHPDIHLKIIEIIRAEYAVTKDYLSLSKIIINYYNQIQIEQYQNSFFETIANIEYIMSYTFLEVRDFKRSKIHLSKLQDLMKKDEKIFFNYIGKSVAIESFIRVFENSPSKAIELIEKTFLDFNTKIKSREKLNLSLNLAGFYCVNQNYKKANQIILNLNKSSNFYLKTMGKEWVLRKDMIKVIIMIELGHIDLADKLIKIIKNDNYSMMEKKQYRMVKPFIVLINKYLESPFEVNLSFLDEIENLTKLDKQKTFRDPRLIIYYAWLKAKFSNKKVYDVLKNEYEQLSFF